MSEDPEWYDVRIVRETEARPIERDYEEGERRDFVAREGSILQVHEGEDSNVEIKFDDTIIGGEMQFGDLPNAETLDVELHIDPRRQIVESIDLGDGITLEAIEEIAWIDIDGYPRGGL